ncbi:MAG: hypothetical protein AVDCRST_MAG96-563 [uncultured Segetibacter sp.]|uniref:Uncharacterized protein n=1 Tax=uncultured Segetibacter sp. TaxID=481133 RepID=A0A6J4RKL6_9BACT|nr:MAG: hypothetical protein AVDCRST_MAG96-563 [uncultured Segetibacter sp.]
MRDNAVANIAISALKDTTVDGRIMRVAEAIQKQIEDISTVKESRKQMVPLKELGEILFFYIPSFSDIRDWQNSKNMDFGILLKNSWQNPL